MNRHQSAQRFVAATARYLLPWLTASLLLLAATSASADSPVTFKAGATASKTEFESPGITLGGSLSGPRWRPFSGLVLVPQLELVLARRHTGFVVRADDNSYTLDFFEVPLLLRAELALGSRSLYAMAGGYGSVLLRADETNSQGLMSRARMASRYDVGVLAAGGFTLASSPWGELFAELRYQRGYLKLLPARDQKHQALSLLVGYGLGTSAASVPRASGGDRRLTLKGGLVATRFQSPGAVASSYVPGFAFGGAFSPVRLGSWMALIPQLEFAFVHRGEHHGVTPAGSLILDDIETSAQVRGEIAVADLALFGVAGLYGSLVVRAQQNLDGAILSMRDAFRPVDAGWLAGVGAAFAAFGDAALTLEVRLQRSLVSRFSGSDDVAIQAFMPATQESLFVVVGFRYGVPDALPKRTLENESGVLYSANGEEDESAQRSGRSVSVRMGRLGDRWLQDIQFIRIERARHNMEYGYQVTYHIAGHGELVRFWSRDEIAFDGSNSESYRRKALNLKQGRLWYPTRITRESLPDVHHWLLEIEQSYAAQADGAIEAMEGFMVVAAIGGGKPTVRTTGSRASLHAGSPRGASVQGGSASGTAAYVAGRGFPSFSAFKRAMGRAGPGYAWHHIVEQTASNVARFGPEAVHNTANIIRLPHGAGSIHARLSGFYSSIRPDITGSTAQTVRQWLSKKSFDTQFSFGQRAIRNFLNGVWP